MQIVVFSAGGNSAQRIAREALGRGHEVIGVVRDPATFTPYDDAGRW
jgi:putative NADH-flavin reductase